MGAVAAAAANNAAHVFLTKRDVHVPPPLGAKGKRRRQLLPPHAPRRCSCKRAPGGSPANATTTAGAAGAAGVAVGGARVVAGRWRPAARHGREVERDAVGMERGYAQRPRGRRLERPMRGLAFGTPTLAG